MEKLFRLKENGTNVRTEILAGLTTFMTMAYIVALNPNLLTNFDTGSPLWNAVFCATLISSGVGTICMAFLANKPFAMSSGMGLNSFFAVVVTQIVAITGVTYTQGFQAGLVIILIETDYSVSEISEMLGFSSPQYFTNTFEKSTGMSPSNYARFKRTKIN